MSRYETGIEKAEREEKERAEKRNNAMKWALARYTTERAEREWFEAGRTQYEKYETGFQQAEREEKEKKEKDTVAATLINIRVTNELTQKERFETGRTMSESDREGMPYVSGHPGWVI
jgi:hypothetical protein